MTQSDGRPLTRFLRVEALAGIALLGATIVALAWASSPWGASYETFWSTDLGGPSGDEDLREWVNSGLMTLFFFVVGLEIKRELVVGRLSSARDAMLPVFAALGGMVVPAALYAALNVGGQGAPGWGIPMATDIAFAVGLLALVGDRVPSGLRVLLLGLAIVDDIGAVVVIAVFYGDAVDAGWLATALAGLLVVVLLRRVGVRSLPVYALVGVAVWFATLESGVHATIAGVALALLTPARGRSSEAGADGSVPVAERLEDLLHPYASLVVVPVFALANAGVRISLDTFDVTSPVTLGVVVGLVAGKLVGVTGAVALAVRFGPARLPPGISPWHIVGMAALAGIGFTVSLFVTDLAFDDPDLVGRAKAGILIGSVLAAAIGVLVLRRAPTPPSPVGAGRRGLRSHR